MSDSDKNLLKAEKPTIKFGIFVKVNFVNSFNKFKNDKEQLQKELLGD